MTVPVAGGKGRAVQGMTSAWILADAGLIVKATNSTRPVPAVGFPDDGRAGKRGVRSPVRVFDTPGASGM